MSWDDVQNRMERADDEASLWVKLKADGDSVVGVFRGDPYPHEVVWLGDRYVDADSPDAAPALKSGKRPSLRITINLAARTESGWTAKVLELSSAFFKDIFKVRDKYGLADWSFEIQRHGAAKSTSTTYSVLPEDRLTDDDKKAIEALDLIDLKALYTESLDDAEKRSKAESFETYVTGEKVADDVAGALITVLRELPEDATKRFLAKFEINRVRDLLAKDKAAAIAFLDVLEAEAKKTDGGSDEVDPLA
jgi:hypothetical protein